jgi:hypothetical protein
MKLRMRALRAKPVAVSSRHSATCRAEKLPANCLVRRSSSNVRSTSLPFLNMMVVDEQVGKVDGSSEKLTSALCWRPSTRGARDDLRRALSRGLPSQQSETPAQQGACQELKGGPDGQPERRACPSFSDPPTT